MNEQKIFTPENFKISLGTHRHKNVIWLEFDYNMALINLLKAHTKAHWSQSRNAWHLADNRQNRSLCHLQDNIVGKEVLAQIRAANLPESQKILILKKY